jgi:hypothetical protein
LYSSPSIIRMVNSKRMWLAGQVALIGETEKTCWLLVWKRKRKKRTIEKARRG